MEEGTTGAMFYDEGKLRDLGEDLIGKAGEFETLINDMFGLIEAMGVEDWKGESYTAFKEMCENFRNNKVTPIIAQIKGWGKGFNDISSDAAVNTANNVKIFEEVI